MNTHSDLVKREYRKLRFKFPMYTEITALALAVRPSIIEGTAARRFFICDDVNSFWFVRMLPGLNAEYEDCDRVLLERDNIDKINKSERLTLNRLVAIINDDDRDQWDCSDYIDVSEAIDSLANIWGVNNLIEVPNG